ncbi:MAG: GxxExxY protein [Pirellulaceae bacterium]
MQQSKSTNDSAPGLLESAYRICLAYELRKRGFEVLEEN